MSFVVDSSVTLSWCFEDEHTPARLALLERVTQEARWHLSCGPSRC